MTAKLDEQTLIQYAQYGDLGAFNLLIDRYQDQLFRIALGLLGDEDHAAGATQAAWISAFCHINEFRGCQLQTWLMRAVVNACYDEIRHQHRRHEVRLPEVNSKGEEPDVDAWLADPAPEVQDRLEADEFEKIIHEGLQSLTPVYRAMLVLIDIEGLSYEEAAIVEGVSLGTIRGRLARARMALRQRLARARFH